MRGKENSKTEIIRRGRITPAYAGKSEPILSEQRQWEDHPRLCGEKLYLLAERAGTAGSPPPMRGKV